MKKKKGFYATLQPFYKKEVRYVQPYYYQDGAWHRLYEIEFKENKNGKRRKSA